MWLEFTTSVSNHFSSTDQLLSDRPFLRDREISCELLFNRGLKPELGQETLTNAELVKSQWCFSINYKDD